MEWAIQGGTCVANGLVIIGDHVDPLEPELPGAGLSSQQGIYMIHQPC
jgi:hypothetical protein